MRKIRNPLARYSIDELKAEIKRRQKLTSRKYYIAYAGSPRVIWGTGRKKATALKDAKRWSKQWADDWNSNNPTKKIKIGSIKIVECDRQVVDAVNAFGGGEIQIRISKGHASLAKGFLKKYKNYSN